jgi:hypothetical protein
MIYLYYVFVSTGLINAYMNLARLYYPGHCWRYNSKQAQADQNWNLFLINFWKNLHLWTEKETANVVSYPPA